MFAKHVPCPLRPPATWDRTRMQSWRSTTSLVTVIPQRRRNPFALSRGARRFYQYPTPAHVKLATWRYASNTVFLLIILVAEEFQLLHLQLLMVGWRIFLAAFVSRTEQQKRPRASAAPSVKVLWIYCFYVMIFKWLDGNVIIYFFGMFKITS